MCVKPDTLYQVLGMTYNTFDEQSVSRNYRDALFHLHPDKGNVCNRSSELVDFKRELVSLAYRILRDDTLRAKYNTMMHRDYSGNLLSDIGDKDFAALRRFEKKIETVTVASVNKQRKRKDMDHHRFRDPLARSRVNASTFVLHMILGHYAG